jgi:hypothetical protein
MPVYQGTYFEVAFLFVDTDDVAIDITDWEFEAQFKDNRSDETALVTLTTANDGFEVTDGEGGRVVMSLSAANTTLLTPAGRFHFDVLRTDDADGPIYLFGGTIKVRRPVTI